jgi:ferredoxin-NADP reductase/ferredoxin/truncated hemoglobin YjbI
MAVIGYRGRDYPAEPGETVLETLSRQGADLPWSCRKGSCQCCMLRLLEGEVESLRELPVDAGGERHLLACVSRPLGDLKLEQPDPSRRAIEVELVARTRLSEHVFALDLAPLRDFSFEAGQYIHLIRSDGSARAYSIVSLPGEDWYFRVHVRHLPGGALSPWLCEELQPGERLHLRGPNGGLRASPGAQTRDWIMLATGTGAGVLHALARETLAGGHAGRITLRHGVRRREELHLHQELSALAEAHPNFEYQPFLSQGMRADGMRQGRVTDDLADSQDVLSNAEIFLCGRPEMVEQARVHAIAAGAARERIHADPFQHAHEALPRDAEKLAALQPDPELWAALGQGPGLTRILEAFYARVFSDERLSPFFHKITPERAIQKQYEFLADVFSGRKAYLGLNPYNAHHWMIISDELFDYRERLFEQVLHESDLPVHLIRRWLAMHELFRAEIVKSAPRGMVSEGHEMPFRTQTVESLDIDSVCDGCGCEIRAGSPSRYQFRLGLLHCADCARLERGVA